MFGISIIQNQRKEEQNPYLDNLIDPSFQGQNRWYKNIDDITDDIKTFENMKKFDTGPGD